MNEQPNGFDQNGRGTLNPPEVDIPVLKKQEKEKKGLGAILPGAVPGAGQVAAGAGAGQAGGLLALLAGKAGLVALGLGVVGAAAVGVGMMGKPAGSAKAAPQLDGLASSISVGQRSAYGSKSLNFASSASGGQLKWEDPNAPKPQADKKSDAPADTAEGVAKADGAADGAGAAEGEGAGGPERPRLSGGLSGAKLSSSLGGSGAFGKANIFSKGTGFNMKSVDLKGKSGIEGGASRLTAAQKGNMSGMGRHKNGLLASSKGTNRVMASKALGQLKFAGNRSQAASGAGSTTGAAQFAADAFDQQKTNGGTLEAASGGPAGADGLGTVNPAGGSAPDMTGGACPEGYTAAEGGGCTPPDINNGKDFTKYQGLVDGVLQMQKTAQMMLMLGATLIIVGLAIMWASGWTGIGLAIGAAIAAAGLALVVMGQMMNKQADQMADQIGNMYNQKKQADVLKARGSGDSSTPELDKRRVEEQTGDANKAGYEEQPDGGRPLNDVPPENRP